MDTLTKFQKMLKDLDLTQTFTDKEILILRTGYALSSLEDSKYITPHSPQFFTEFFSQLKPTLNSEICKPTSDNEVISFVIKTDNYLQRLKDEYAKREKKNAYKRKDYE